MSVTTRIPEDHLAEYFEAFTKKVLLDESAGGLGARGARWVHQRHRN